MKTCRGTCEPTRTDPRLAETRALYRSSPTETRDVACAWFCQAERELGLLPFLAVGGCLRERGFEITAEPCALRPPLWRAERRGDTPALFIDVVPIDLSQSELLEFRVSSHLVETLQSIPVNQRLHMAVTDFRRILDEESRERIVEKTRDWLAAKRLSVGDRLQLHGAILTMMPRDKPRDHLAVIGPAFSYWIRKLKIDVILLDRVLQQREAAAEHPYVLAAVAPERVGLSRRCYSELLNERPDAPEHIQQTRTDDARRAPLFRVRPEISAAAWAWKSSRGIWEMRAIHNPAARHPLPDGTFDASA